MTSISSLTGNYTLDPEHARIGFVTRHAMVTKVRGGFDEFDGKIHIDGENPSQSTAEITIKAASIDTRNEQRDGHLRTNDFLDAEKYPEIKFSTTEVEQLSENSFRVTGDLSIKDVTRPVSIEFDYEGTAKDPFGNIRIGFEGSTRINRKDFNVTWNAPLETGGVLVSDNIDLEFEISAIKAD